VQSFNAGLYAIPKRQSRVMFFIGFAIASRASGVRLGQDGSNRTELARPFLSSPTVFANRPAVHGEANSKNDLKMLYFLKRI
jgi:hypothetical protein